jgi:peptidyl-prolyl cis-trans isomerase SurA
MKASGGAPPQGNGAEAMIVKHILLVVCGAAALNAVGQSLRLDGVAAYIDDKVLTVGEVRDAAARQVQELTRRYEGPELTNRVNAAYRQALDNLIARELILKAFPKTGGAVSDKALARAVNNIVAADFNNDRSVLMEYLGKRGQTYKDFENEIRDNIIIYSMRDQYVTKKIMISPTAVRAAYERDLKNYEVPARFHLRVIVILGGADETDKAARRAVADDIRAKAGAGADFAALARKVSEDPRREQGGDWGWMEAGDLNPQLTAFLGALKPGDVTPVLGIEGDWYIVKLEGSSEAGVRPLAAVQKTIEKELREAEENRVYRDWIERLKRDYNVKLVPHEGE